MSKQIRVSDAAYEVIKSQAELNKRRVLADQVDVMLLDIPVSPGASWPLRQREQLLDTEKIQQVIDDNPSVYAGDLPVKEFTREPIEEPIMEPPTIRKQGTVGAPRPNLFKKPKGGK